MAEASPAAQQRRVNVTLPWAPDGEIEANLAIGSLRDSLQSWLTTDRGVHVETLMTVVGSLAGFAAQQAVWDQIRKAGVQHERGNEVVRRNSLAMREVALQVADTTREQAKGTATIARSVERVRDAVAEIHQALTEQGGSSAEAVDFLEEVHARTRSHDESASILAEATHGLLRNAQGLRESIRRFRL